MSRVSPLLSTHATRAGKGGEEDLLTRLRDAKARLRYHSRPSAGATRTRIPAGEAKALARADVTQLTYLLSLPKCSRPT